MPRAARFTLSAFNPTGDSPDSAVISAIPRLLWADYQAQYGISGPKNDTNSDGLTDLAAYALGLNPTESTSGKLPVASLEGSHLTLTFTRRKSPTDIIYRVETTGDLATWDFGSEFVTEIAITPISSELESVTFRDEALTSDAKMRAMRVRFTLPASP